MYDHRMSDMLELNLLVLRIIKRIRIDCNHPSNKFGMVESIASLVTTVLSLFVPYPLK